MKDTIEKRSQNFAFYILIFKILFNLYVSLFPLWQKSAREKLQKCNKSKANPKQTQSNPIFPRSNIVLSEITGIFDKFGTTFFCKTNPIYKNERWSMTHQKTLKITNKAILKIDQMNVTIVLTNDYNRMDTWYRGKNKPISKPFCYNTRT